MPDVLLHGVVGNTFSRQHVLLLTYVLPLTVLMSLLVIGRIPWIEKRKLIAPFGLAGIWLSGGLAMSISATFSGGGFATLDGWRGVVLGAIPPFTFMMASYDGSLFALLLTTLCLLTVWLVGVVRPKLLLHAGVISGLAALVILVTALCQVALTIVASRLREPVSAAQQQRDDELDSLALAVKSAYHGSSEVPPYLPDRPAVIAVSNLLSVLAKSQIEVPQKFASFHYCNLKPELWSVLRKHHSAERRGLLSPLTFDRTSYEELKRFGEYPVVWGSHPDASNLVVVVTVSFTTDIFRPCVVNVEDFHKALKDMQSLIRKETADESFSLVNNIQ